MPMPAPIPETGTGSPTHAERRDPEHEISAGWRKPKPFPKTAGSYENSA